MANQNNNITSATAVLALGVTGLYAIPQQLSGFADDDMFSVPNVDVTQTIMGADGILSAGWIPSIKIMEITLQADSDSTTFFEAWHTSMEAARTPYKAFGILTEESVSKVYTLTNGRLVGYSPMADAKKVLQPRKFQIHWQSIIAAAI
jgi:hypothetical protein